MIRNLTDSQKRKFCVSQTIANFAMEGEHPSSKLKSLFEDFVQGGFDTVEEMKRVYADTQTYNQVDINMLNALEYGVEFTFR